MWTDFRTILAICGDSTQSFCDIFQKNCPQTEIKRLKKGEGANFTSLSIGFKMGKEEQEWECIGIPFTHPETGSEYEMLRWVPKQRSSKYPDAERLIQATGAEIHFFGTQAYYRTPKPLGSWPNHTHGDWIAMPPRSQFGSESVFYATAFHELAHWSCVRIGWNLNNVGVAEMIADLSSLAVAQQLGIPHKELAADVDSMLLSMSHEPFLIAVAQEQAVKVADFLLSFVK